MDARNATRNLTLATVAFAVAFVGWSLIAPLAKRFQDDLDLSNTRTLALTAVPVILGSLLRIPVGVLTDRVGGRRDVPGGARRVCRSRRRSSASSTAIRRSIVVGFFLGIAGSSFAVGVPFVAGWYPKERQGFALGVYGMGNIGTAVAAFSAPAIVEWLGREALGIFAAALLLVDRRRLLPDGRGPAARPGRPLRRRAPLGLEALAARAPLLRDVRRLRRDGGVPAEAAARLVRHLADRRGATRRRLHGRRDVRPAGGRVPVRPDRLGHGARSSSSSAPASTPRGWPSSPATRPGSR